MFYTTDNILQNISHIQTACEEYSAQYYQSDWTLLWLLCKVFSIFLRH
jgi:hypothetical protein